MQGRRLPSLPEYRLHACQPERKDALIAELKQKIFTEQTLSQQLKDQIASLQKGDDGLNDAYIHELKQKIKELEGKNALLTEGYQVDGDLEVGDKWLPVIVYVRPANKSAKVVVNVPKAKEMMA